MNGKIMKKLFLFIFSIMLIVLGVGYLLGSKSNNDQNITEINSSGFDKTVLCKRNEPYQMKPEFERGLSLLYQRIEEHRDDSTVQVELKTSLDILLQIRNCLNVQYSVSDNEEAEGFFVFDPDSSTENLEIFVNKKYSSYDDALTALLLAHEVTHAVQLVDSKINDNNKSCVDKEIESIRMEYRLLRSFTYAENTSIKSRITYETEGKKNLPETLQDRMMEYSGLVGVIQLLDIQDKMLARCSAENEKRTEDQWVNIFECAGEIEKEYIREYILDNPFYRKQCDL